MANRVTSDEVKVIIDWDGTTSLDPFITSANQIVTEQCSDSSYSDDRLEMIELWLSGHFYTMFDRATVENKTENATEKFNNRIGLMLFNTLQGQNAMLMDTDGNLAELSRDLQTGKIDITVSWMGEDYDDTESSNY